VTRTTRSTFACATLAGLAFLVAAPARPATSIPARSSADCPGSDAQPSQITLALEREALLCLINRERMQRALRSLRPNARLGHAARSQSLDMVRHSYFDHRRRGRPGFVARIRETGYLSGARGWLVAENLAWGVDSAASAASIVEGWMQSGEHRRNILESGFRNLGVGIARGSPDGHRYGSRAAITATADFGVRY
jgi:uncharacterized protein YkwD